MFRSRSIRKVDASAAAQTLSQPETVALDIRTPEEHESGTIKGANNIDFREPTFAGALEDLDRDGHYVVF